MQIVIEIDERIIEHIKNQELPLSEVDTICESILEGTSLPKGHGRDCVLDKIRAEIERHRRKTESIDTYDLVGDCLDIIDKYKTESEDKG